MAGASLQFQGGGQGQWLGVLLVALAGALALHGLWQLREPRGLARRVALLASALGPLAALPILRELWPLNAGGGARWAILLTAGLMGPLASLPSVLVEWAARRRAGQAAQGWLTAAAALAVLVAAGAAVYGVAPTVATLWTMVTLWWVVLAVAVFYAGAYGHLGARRLTVLLMLRLAAVAALLGLLFKPALSIPPQESSPPLTLPVLVDRSASMGVGNPARYAQAVHELRGQAQRIGEHFAPAWHPFARRLGTAGTLEDLERLDPARPDSDATNIAQALRDAVGGRRRSDLAGVLLVSDGRHNVAGESIADAVLQAGVPIYTIALGSAGQSAAAGANARVQAVDAPLEAVRDNRCTITARVDAAGLAGRTLRVRLMQGEQALDEQLVTPAGLNVTETVRLGFIPSDQNAPATGSAAPAADIRRLTVSVTPVDGEAVVQDNDLAVHVLVTEPRIRVCYIESIRPEFRFLSAQLRQDPNVQLVTLVRVSARQFAAQGAIGGQMLGGLPSTAGEFGLFDVVILGSIGRTAWTDEQLRLLVDFVRGGKGLLLVGGQETFGPGGYGGDCPLQEILPVICGPLEVGQEYTAFIPQATAEGRASPVLAGTEDFFPGPDGQPAKTRLPELTGCVNTLGLRPGASALLVHPTRGNQAGPLVVLAEQLVADPASRPVADRPPGRVLAFTADTTWRWHLWAEGQKVASPYARFWQQAVRYLAHVQTRGKDTGASVLGRTDHTYLQSGQTLRLTARVQDATGVSSTAAVTVVPVPAERPDQPLPAVSLRPSGAAGIYEGTFLPPAAGTYTLRFAAADQAGKELGADELPLVVAGQEMDDVTPDEALLRDIAQRSDGICADIRALPEVIDRIIERCRGRADAPASPSIVRLFDFTGGFLLFVGLITVEWLLRRHWQLQ